jgi:hypothetical protein
VCTVRTRAQNSILLGAIMAGKNCAHPPCTCVAEAGKNSALTHAATLAPRDMRAAATIRAVRPSRAWEDIVRD